jgi:Ca2+-binding EF-hand superfamily protein
MQAPGLRVFETTELDALRKVFSEFDSADSGYVTCGDLLPLLHAAGFLVSEDMVPPLASASPPPCRERAECVT